MIKYIINKEKGAVTAILNDANFNKQFIGVARLNPEDEWDEEVGRHVAKSKAILKSTAYGIQIATQYKSKLEAQLDYVNCWIENQSRHYNVIANELMSI